MIDRYSLKEMSLLWSVESRFSYMLEVEKTVAQVQGDLGIIPKKASQSIRDKSQFSLPGILKKEQTTHHDVTAFIQEVTSHLGEEGAYFHYGLTSSDVLDTALSLQIKAASKVFEKSFQQLKLLLKNLVETHQKTLCVGRTHGIHAEPTTFGFKILGFLAELLRAETSFKEALEQCCIVKLSGAVGTYTSLSSEVELKVAQILKLKQETLATQVIPRDRLARLMFSLSLVGSFLERLSLELRHLQRTEVAEVTEGFSKGQTGSSAMPHKKNPISAENLSGVARLLRSYISPALENISLWHERDISHSSVERVLLPDAFILAHYGLERMARLLKNLEIHPQKMLENLGASRGLVFSSQVLNQLVSKGVSRQKAYEWIQSISHNRKEEENLEDLLKQDLEIKKYLNEKELKNIFSGQKNVTAIVGHISKVLKEM